MSADPTAPVQLDTQTPQLILSLCNIYLGLKIGWGMNMSIAAALLGFGFWQTTTRVAGLKRFGILENNINQTAASAAASIASAGLVAPIPALTMLTGRTLTYPQLVGWVLSVALVGVVVAVGVRKQLLVVDKLTFPTGFATGQTLKEIYAHGNDALARLRMLVGGMVLGAVGKLVAVVASLKAVGPTFAIHTKAGALSLKNLGFAADPSAMMYAVGAIIGPRGALSMLLGAVVAWGVIAPQVVGLGWAERGADDLSAVWFGPVVKWMLWPGVAMMVTASLTSFAFSWRSMLAAILPRDSSEDVVDPAAGHDVSKRLLAAAFVAVGVISVALQRWLFDVPFAIAVLGVALTFVLALVAGRVSGETNVTPVGPMGKVTQLTFGLLDPGNVASNLMVANVTGGAASQCADLLHDLKSGEMVGASPRSQAISQAFGVVAGALAGCAAYMVLVPDPANMLLTEEWAAPAVAQWKAVAEVFSVGISAMPEGALQALFIGGAVGCVMAIVEKLLPPRIRRFVPSPVSVGLAFCIPAYYAISFAAGAVIRTAADRFFPSWSARFALVLAAGLIAGESLAGVVDAVRKMFTA
jgi:putative OPT family oligopeptide transporter